MPQSVGNVTATLNLDTRRAEAAYKRFEQTVARGRGRDNLFGSISADAKDFENSLGKATNRVVAFGAAAAVFTTLARAATEFARSIIEVDASLAKINVNLGQSQQGLKQFSSELFNIARQTGQTFEVTAKAAEELARQGLGAQETTKRLKDALILSRIASIDSAEAVETLTAAINSFNESALTSTEVVNKFAAVDTKFAVSSNDLAQAISRVGSTAQSAGVGINELIGLVTSLQQTTARGGATIGNGLKTIFTRIQAAPETVSALEGIGVAIKNTDGSLRDAVSILRDYGVAREKVGEAERAALDRTVAGTFQINILKAALTDLTRQYSVYDSAVQTANQATDEAIRKNEQLNQTLSSLINSTAVTIKQFFASVGQQDIGPILSTLLKGFEKVRAFFSGDSGSDLGKSLGEGLLQGISNVISGPALGALLLIIGKAFGKVLATISQEARTLLSINNAAQTRANIQKQINVLLSQANSEERASIANATTLLAQQQALLAVQTRRNRESAIGSPIVRSFKLGGKLSGLGPQLSPNFADPLGDAISREKAAGVPSHQIYVDRDARVASFANPLGLLVANTRDEPLGGYQGVSRVISQGGNPKTNGIPGFASTFTPLTAQDLMSKNGSIASDQFVTDINQLLKSMRGLDRSRIKGVAEEIRDLAKAFNLSATSLKIINQRILTAQSLAARKEGVIVSDQSRYARYKSPTDGGFDASRDIMDRNIARAQGYSVPSSSGPFQYSEQDRVLRDAKAAQIRAARRERDRITSESRLAAQERKRQSIQNRTLVGAFALPLLGGFGDTAIQGAGFSTAGGTGGGMLSGALAYGTQAAGFGALTGNPAIAGIAGAAGALVGAFTKMRKSTDEIVAAQEELSAARGQEIEALSRATALREQIKESQEQGLSPAVIAKLQTELIQVSKSITSPQAKAVLGATTDQARSESEIKLLADNAVKEAAKNIAIILSGGGSGNLRKEFLGGLNETSANSLTPANLQALGRAARGTFDVTANTTGFGPASNQNEVDQATIAYTQSLKELTPLLNQFEIDISLVNRGNLPKVAEALQKALLDFGKIIKQTTDASKTGAIPLSKGAFLNAPNLDVYRQGAARGTGQSRGQKSQSQFDLFTEVARNGGINLDTFGPESIYGKARAGVQSNNALAGIAAFLQSNNPGVGRLTDARGDYNASAILRQTEAVASGGGRNADIAKEFAMIVKRVIETQKQAGSNTVGFVEGTGLAKDALTGYTPGGNYGAFDATRERGTASRYITSGNLPSILDQQRKTPFMTIKQLQERNNDVNFDNQSRFDLMGKGSTTTTNKSDPATEPPISSTVKTVKADINVNINGSVENVDNAGLVDKITAAITDVVRQGMESNNSNDQVVQAVLQKLGIPIPRPLVPGGRGDLDAMLIPGTRMTTVRTIK
jgi:TP901 family phage tail tape measure protein